MEILSLCWDKEVIVGNMYSSTMLGTIFVLPEITGKDEQQEAVLPNLKHNQNPVPKGHKPGLFGKTKTEEEKVIGALCSKEQEKRKLQSWTKQSPTISL